MDWATEMANSRDSTSVKTATRSLEIRKDSGFNFLEQFMIRPNSTDFQLDKPKIKEDKRKSSLEKKEKKHGKVQSGEQSYVDELLGAGSSDLNHTQEISNTQKLQ